MILSIKIRIFLIIALIASGLVGVLLNLHPGVSLVMWLSALILILSYLLFGSVNTALFWLKSGRIDKAEEALNKGIYKVEWLLKSHKAYYYFTKGLIGLYRSQENTPEKEFHLKEGEDNLLKSLEIGLSRKQERAMAYLNLAHAAFFRRDKAKATEYTQKLKENQTADLQLQKKTEELEAALQRL